MDKPMEIKIISAVNTEVRVAHVKRASGFECIAFTTMNDEYPYAQSVALTLEQADGLYRQLGAMLEEIQRAKEAA